MTNQPSLATGPYSTYRKGGGLYFFSGVTGIQVPSLEAAVGIEAQTEHMFKNVTAALAIAGLESRHVIKTTLFLTGMAGMPVVNRLYGKYFDQPRPARSTVGVRELPRVARFQVPLLVEMDFIAAEDE